MKIDHVFPIPIARCTIDDYIIANTTDLVNKYVIDSKITEPAAPGELLTTFYKDKNFLGNIGDTGLLDYINRMSRQYLDLLGLEKKSFIEITSWLQFNQPRSYFVRHDHYGALISGVIYLNVPENSGNIMFHNPLEQRRVTNAFFEKVKNQDSDYNFSHITYTPIVGEMILFESWLQHTVQQNMSDENRISIGFNIWAGPDAKS